MIPVRNLIRSATKPVNGDDKLNILTSCRNNERYISLLAQTGHNFYIPIEHPWNNMIAPKPDNVYILGMHSPPLDFLICYDRAEQYIEAQQIARQLHLPVILADLCSASLVRPHHILETLTPRNPEELLRTPTTTVYSSEIIAESWGGNSPHIIPLTFDARQLNASHTKPEEIIITIDNNVSPEVGTALSAVLNNQYQILPTDTDNHEDRAILKSTYFINTKKNITIKLIEAMFCKNIVICLRTPDAESLIEHKKTGILIDDLPEIPETINMLNNDTGLRDSIAENAHEQAISMQDIDGFTSQWNNIFQLVRSNFYSPSI